MAPETERRKHARFAVDDVVVKVMKRGLAALLKRQNIAHHIIDLSEGGVQVTLEVPLPVGTRVTFHMRVEKFRDELEMNGEVRWCTDRRCGIEFEDSGDEHRRKIANLRSYFTAPQVLTKIREKREKTALALRPPKKH